MPGLLRVPDCLAELGARAASRETVSFTYLQAVAVPTSNPATSSVNVSPLRRWTSTSRACRPGFSFRQGEPIAARWRRMTPDTKVRVRDDSGSAAR